jgi:hypothetical protein
MINLHKYMSAALGINMPRAADIYLCNTYKKAAPLYRF